MARASSDVLKGRAGDGCARTLPSGTTSGAGLLSFDAVVALLRDGRASERATEIATMAESPRDRVCCKNMAE